VSKVEPLGEEMTTLDQLQSRIAKLQKQAEDLMRKKASSVVADIRKLMTEHGLTTADIAANTAAPKTGAKRGPKPGFKRAGKSATAAPTKKAASQTKGKLPAKYLNPKTGETWSGWARPPEWIKNVKDRSKFLIAGASAAVDAGSASKAKLAGKNVAAKKMTAVKKAVPTTKTAVAKKVTGKKAVSAKTPAKKAIVKKAAPTAIKKAPSKKVPRNGAAATAAATTAESGANATT
jgi:DNA-binding protein H-NS